VEAQMDSHDCCMDLAAAVVSGLLPETSEHKTLQIIYPVDMILATKSCLK